MIPLLDLVGRTKSLMHTTTSDPEDSSNFPASDKYLGSIVMSMQKSLPLTSHSAVTLTPSGMVMLLIPRVAVTPLSDGKDTLEKCYSTLR